MIGWGWLAMTCAGGADLARVERVLELAPTAHDAADRGKLVLRGLTSQIERDGPTPGLLPEDCGKAIAAGFVLDSPDRLVATRARALAVCPGDCADGLPADAAVDAVLAACDAAGRDTLFAGDEAVRSAVEPVTYRIARIVWDALTAATADGPLAPAAAAVRRDVVGVVVMAGRADPAVDWRPSANLAEGARDALVAPIAACAGRAMADRLVFRLLVGPDGTPIDLRTHAAAPTWGDCRYAPRRARLPPTRDGGLGVIDAGITLPPPR